jgi:hypothetical protein
MSITPEQPARTFTEREAISAPGPAWKVFGKCNDLTLNFAANRNLAALITSPPAEHQKVIASFLNTIANSLNRLEIQAGSGLSMPLFDTMHQLSSLKLENMAVQIRDLLKFISKRRSTLSHGGSLAE